MEDGMNKEDLKKIEACPNPEKCIQPEAEHYELISKTIRVAVIRCPHCGEVAAEMAIDKTDTLGYQSNL